MHLRRALLLFALVLGMTALAASIAPPPPEQEAAPTGPATTVPTTADSEEMQLAFKFPVGRRAPPTRRVEPDTPLIVTVSSDEPGQVSIPKLGRTTSVTPNDPARFSLLAPDPGRYEVTLTPTVGGEPHRLGTIASEA